MKYSALLILLSIYLSINSCSKETSVYPPTLTEFATLQTDLSGCMHTLQTDNGFSYAIQNATSHKGFTPDSIYRVIALYKFIPAPIPTIHLYNFTQVISPQPISNWTNEIKQDPVKIQSIWVKGNYLNLVLLVKAQSEPHTFHFIETKNESMLDLTLYHDKGKDTEAYTQRAYLSVPLQQYKSRFQQLQFNINTIQGLKTYVFEF